MTHHRAVGQREGTKEWDTLNKKPWNTAERNCVPLSSKLLYLQGCGAHPGVANQNKEL